MLALCSYHLGIEYNTNFYLNKAERVLYHILHPDGEPNYYLWDDDLFFYYFVSGLTLKSNNPDSAQEYFNKAYFHMKRTEGMWFFVYTMFAIEQADLYELRGERDKALGILNDCMDFCNKNGYKHKEEILFAKIHNHPLIRKHISLSSADITKNQIEELTNFAEIQTMLKSKTKGINFLVSWQELMNKDNMTPQSIIDNSMVTIQNNYNIDCIIYVDTVDDKPVVRYNESNAELNDERLERITKYIKKHKKEFIASRFDREFYDYSIIYEFGINNVSSFACIPLISGENVISFMICYLELHENMRGIVVFLDKSDINIFKFALHQMSDTLYRIKYRDEIKEMNHRLQQIAVTDLLTGLLNRQGFAKKLDDHLKLVETDSSKNTCATLMYIDLDNFKMCNDNFGHDVGDAILIAFSRLFEKTVEDKGYIIRYGGDEFLIVLPGFGVDTGIEIAKKIYEEIEKSQGFKSDIEEIIHREAVMPEKNRVNCSIGIAFMEEYNNDSMNDALKQADTMLYEAKKNNKSTYYVWED